MLTTITELLSKVFKTPSYQEGLEKFLSSRNPSSASEVDYWIRVYDRKGSGNSYGI